MRIALVFVVVGVAAVLALWAMGVVGASDAMDGLTRTVVLVAIGAGALAAVRSLLSGSRPPSSGGHGGQGPRF